MRGSTVVGLAFLALVFGLAAYATPAQDQSSDDVAAAARKAREKQKDAPKPKKVITNDDMPSAPATQSTPASTASKPGGQEDSTQASKAGGSQNEGNAKGEAYWRKRFSTLHGKLSTAERELDVLQRELNKDQVQYYADPQKALTQQYDRSDINEKTSKIDAKKKEIESIKQQISDLEDELRKANGDPGWAR